METCKNHAWRSIETSIFRRTTNLGIYTRWDSYVPNRYKQNLIWTLLHQGYSICIHSYGKRISKNVKPSRKKGFSLNYINRQIQHFLAKKEAKKKQNRQERRHKSDFYATSLHKKEMNGHISKDIKGLLKKLDFKFTFILINKTFNLKRLFTFKECQNKLHRSSVVYCITCSCKSTYIGQTSRSTIIRLKKSRPHFAK